MFNYHVERFSLKLKTNIWDNAYNYVSTFVLYKWFLLVKRKVGNHSRHCLLSFSLSIKVTAVEYYFIVTDRFQTLYVSKICYLTSIKVTDIIV